MVEMDVNESIWDQRLELLGRGAWRECPVEHWPQVLIAPLGPCARMTPTPLLRLLAVAGHPFSRRRSQQIASLWTLTCSQVLAVTFILQLLLPSSAWLSRISLVMPVYPKRRTA